MFFNLIYTNNGNRITLNSIINCLQRNEDHIWRKFANFEMQTSMFKPKDICINKVSLKTKWWIRKGEWKNLERRTFTLTTNVIYFGFKTNFGTQVTPLQFSQQTTPRTQQNVIVCFVCNCTNRDKNVHMILKLEYDVKKGQQFVSSAYHNRSSATEIFE